MEPRPPSPDGAWLQSFLASSGSDSIQITVLALGFRVGAYIYIYIICNADRVEGPHNHVYMFVYKHIDVIVGTVYIYSNLIHACMCAWACTVRVCVLIIPMNPWKLVGWH